MAVQIVRYEQGKRVVVRHIGSAHTDAELSVLRQEAEHLRERLCVQPILPGLDTPAMPFLHAESLCLQAVTHRFAYDALRRCCEQCGLHSLAPLYQDLALMRLIEPASKLRTLELLRRHFDVAYAARTVYRLLPELIEHKAAIEEAAYVTARSHFSEAFAVVLYDVTTLYFESQEADDELLARGFSKDDKSKQPQIVLGLLVTPQGFPLMHEVYKGNTFEGHTMLGMVQSFQQRHPDTQPIIVADAAMLSRENLQRLEAQGYRYIVGARLANTTRAFIDQIAAALPRHEGACIRIPSADRTHEVICTYSEKRYKKDRREFDKQIERAKNLIARKEPGKRAKFVKKSNRLNEPYVFDHALREKTAKLLGIKGYSTNIPQRDMADASVVQCYHDLWHVEQAFRMSKTDLRTRPIFHHRHEAIKAHVLLCFMALMMAKFLEIKTGLSLRQVRDILWSVHEAHIVDSLTGRRVTLQTNLSDYHDSGLADVLKPH